MPAIRLSPFSGMVPAVDDRLIPDTAAAYARDTWLYAGTVVGLPVLKELRTNSSVDILKVYRIPRGFNDSTHLEDSLWLEFTDLNTDVIKSMVLADTFERYYWASPTTVPKYNTRARIAANLPPYKLGVTQANMPTVTFLGGSGTQQSRAYVTTWVTSYGEEGPPSDPFLSTGGYSNSAWTILLTPPIAGDMGTDRDIIKTRIYRTIVGTDGTTTYFFVKDVPATTTSTTDTLTDQQISANGQLQSTLWAGPPSDLQGWVTLANGMVVGWRNNELWFCEPFRPHAWPAAYSVAVEYPIVGLGVSNQTLVILTSGYPYLGSGTHPSSFSITKLSGLLPCLSRGSIVATVEGVYYTSPEGLTLVSASGITIVTKELIRKDKWLSLVPTSTLRAVRVCASYYAFGSSRQGVFETTAFETTAFTQVDYAGARRGVLIDPTSTNVAFSILSSTIPVVNTMTDAWSGEVFIIKGNKTYWFDIGDSTNTKAPYLWRSKIFQTSTLDNFQAMKLYWKTPTWPVATITDADGNAVVGVVRVYADGRLIMTRSMLKSGEMWRMPSGFKADFWQFELESTVEITSLQAATSASELRGV